MTGQSNVSPFCRPMTHQSQSCNVTTSPCAGNPLLSTFDKVLRCGYSKILNVNLNDTQWTQAILPVYMGCLRVRSACMLAPSAFLASAAANLSLREAILPDQVCSTDGLTVSMTLSVWKTLTPDGQPSNTTRHIQKALDTPVVRNIYSDLLISCDTPVDKDRLKIVTVTHGGDWLNAASITAVSLRLSDEAVHVAVGHRLGSTTCQPHTCICGIAVDAR